MTNFNISTIDYLPLSDVYVHNLKDLSVKRRKLSQQYFHIARI